MLGINKWDEYEKDSVLLPLTKNAGPISSFHLERAIEVNANILFKSIDRSILTGMQNGAWPYILNQEVGVSDDYLNILVYPEETITAQPDADLQISIDYSDSFGQGYRTTHALNYYMIENGTGYYSIDNVRASDLQAIKEIKVERISGRGDVALGDVIVHQIRDAQIIQTSTFDMGGKPASASPSATVSNTGMNTQEQQVVTLIFADDMDELSLLMGNMDVAVALNYTSAQDPTGKEYISSYVYLTAEEINSIVGGQSNKLTFNVPNVSEVTGITVAATGGLAIKIDRALITVYENIAGTLKMKNWYSICDAAEVVNGSSVLPVITKALDSKNTLIPVTMTIKTGVENGINTGTQAPIRLVIEYQGFDEESYTVEIPDIRKYTVSGDYSTNGEAVVELFVKNVKEINRVTFEPYDNIELNRESWKIGSLSLEYGIEKDVKKVDITLADRKAFAYENSPVKIAFNKVVVTLGYSDGNGMQMIQNSTAGCIVEAGKVLGVAVDIDNASTSPIVRAYEVVGDSRRDVTSDYLTFDEEEMDIMFKVPKELVTTENLNFEIVVGVEGFPEFESSLSVVVIPATETEAPEGTEGSEETEVQEGSEESEKNGEDSTITP
jgi:hypothetical protein